MLVAVPVSVGPLDAGGVDVSVDMNVNADADAAVDGDVEARKVTSAADSDSESFGSRSDLSEREEQVGESPG